MQNIKVSGFDGDTEPRCFFSWCGTLVCFSLQSDKQGSKELQRVVCSFHREKRSLFTEVGLIYKLRMGCVCRVLVHLCDRGDTSGWESRQALKKLQPVRLVFLRRSDLLPHTHIYRHSTCSAVLSFLSHALLLLLFCSCAACDLFV